MRHSMGTAALGSKGKTYRLSMTALMTAITCVLAPFSVPVGPVPISLTNLVILATTLSILLALYRNMWGKW